MNKEETKVVVDAEKEYEEIKKTNVNKNVTEPINPSEIKEETPENKKKSNTKKIIAIVTSVIVVICLAVVIWFIVERCANKWEVKQNEVTIEYGEVYEPTIADLVDVEKYPNIKNSNTSIKINDATYVINSKNHNTPVYYDVGDYDIVIVHKIEYKLFGATIFTIDDTKKIKLEVKDTVAPVFVEDTPRELETYKDCEIENIEEKFKATDFASVTISINKDKIDYSTVGEYTTNVQAIDESGNVTIQEIKVKVLEPTIEVDKISLNMTVGNTETITATVKGQDQTVEWNSSDESVAKVDNGNITAKKAGSTKIIAKANGVEKVCEITVEEKAVAPSNNRSSSKNNNKPSNSNSSRPASNGGNSSSSNGGSSNGSNNNGGNSSSSSAPTTSGCASGNHSMSVGNIGRWFNSRSEVDAYFSSTCTQMWNKYQSGAITRDEYIKNCPSGYKAWSCSNCGKWTGNFTY